MGINLTIKSAVRMIKTGQISAVDFTRTYLDKATAMNPSINAYLRLLPDRALHRAREIDRKIAKGEQLGPLCGIPIAIKDNMNLKGVEISAGSRILQGFRSPFNATAIEMLEAADAIIIGITNMDEFAMGSSTENSAFGITRNPRNLEYVPGGSSGGSAAAVAADLALGALGTDTGGSIRLPASFCGLVGLKPTYGRVSRYGIIAYASSLDQVGPFGKTVEDVALLLNVISGFDGHDATSLNQPVPDYTSKLQKSLKGIRIGIPQELFGEGFDEAVRTNVLSAITEFSKMGAEIKEISLPTLDYALATYYLIACAEASANLQRYDGVRFGHRAKGTKSLQEMIKKSRSEGFGQEVQRRILLGTYILSAGYYEAYYLKAQKVRTLIQRDFAKAFDQVDIIAGPVSPVLPFKLGEKITDPLSMYLTDVATTPINLVGIPALSVPCGEANSLPIGLQLMANHMQEQLLLRVAYQYEQNKRGTSDPYPINPRRLGAMVERDQVAPVEMPIDKVAELAYLVISDENKSSLSRDIGDILGYVDLLNKADIEETLPTAHPVPTAQHLRKDEETPFIHPEGTLGNAPDKEGNAFKIPPILER